MNDIERKALELLAAEYEADGCMQLARMIRSGAVTDPDFGSVKIMRAMRAIIAALTPPESYLLIQRVDAKRLVQGDTNSPGYELSCRRVAALICACQEVK